MSTRVDHDARRSELAAAVWRIVLREGVAGASVRAVARESQLSMGSVRYFFHTQDELLQFAMRQVISRARARAAAGVGDRELAARAGDPIGAVAVLLEELLPLDDERVIEARIWVAFAAVEGDPAMAKIRYEADEAIRQVCATSLHDMATMGLLDHGRDLELETEHLWALLDGLTMHLLAEWAPTTPIAAREILHRHLRSLASATGLVE